MGVISHIPSITVPLGHTCTTYRPAVLIKKTTDISSGKKNKRLMSHFRPQGERVQMNKWSLSSPTNHLCNVTSIVCAHLCQQPRLSQNVRLTVLTNFSFSYTASLSFLSFPPPLSLFFHYNFYALAPSMTDLSVLAPLVLSTLNKTYQLNQLQSVRWRCSTVP